MIEKELETIVREQKEGGATSAFIVNVLKEYLQVHVLYFLYTSAPHKKNLIFTGGTCLRHFYGLERLSEDIDFDAIAACDSDELARSLKVYFASKLKYPDLTTAVKARGGQVLLKFPVLKKLRLARTNDSDLLHVKIDLSPLPSKNYSIQTTTKSSFGINYAAIHYDLPSLMAGKLHALLTRKYLKGRENQSVVKGRDYFDLLWFVRKGVRPNFERLSDMLNERITLAELRIRVDEKVDSFIKRHKSDFEVEMKPLIKNPEFLKIFVDNYREEYLRNKNQSFLSITHTAAADSS